jgi:hypothetical protein
LETDIQQFCCCLTGRRNDSRGRLRLLIGAGPARNGRRVLGPTAGDVVSACLAWAAAAGAAAAGTNLVESYVEVHQ